MKKILYISFLFFSSCINDIRDEYVSVNGTNNTLDETTIEESSSYDDSEPNRSPHIPKLDVYEFPTIDPEDCKNVDFLFVIDNSGSMQDEQDKLIDNFDVFSTGLENTIINVKSLHIGIITTDAYSYNPVECQTLGALVTSTQDEQCGPYIAGDNFITESDNIEEKFACAANVGVWGDSTERQIEAPIAALEGFINSDNQCNAGFVRDDAIAVIFIITDEDILTDVDSQIPVDTLIDSIYEHFVYLKNEDENIVFIVMTIIENGKCNNNLHKQNIIDLSGRFKYGLVGDLCEEDYSQMFLASVDLINSACLNLDPPPYIP